MKAEISPDRYRRFGADFNRIKGYSLSKFIKWLAGVYQAAYDDGWNDAMDAYKETNGGIAVDESVDAEVIDADALMDILLSVKGIGQRRAQEVIDRICKGGTGEGILESPQESRAETHV